MQIGHGQISAVSTLRVPFHDADPAGVVWHGNYFKYFDAARCLILDAMDYGYARMAESGFVWPVVDARARYVSAIWYDETIDVRATLVEWEYRLKFEYLITGADGGRKTTGYTVQVAVDMKTRDMSLCVPDFVRERVACLAKTC